MACKTTNDFGGFRAISGALLAASLLGACTGTPERRVVSVPPVATTLPAPAPLIVPPEPRRVAAPPAIARPAPAPSGYQAVGVASWYGKKFHGRTTANGEIYNMDSLTAAHRSLPFGTRLEVTNLANNRSVIVTVNDRGPFVGDRIIDLSRRAAADLGFMRKGLARVRLQEIGATHTSSQIARVVPGVAVHEARIVDGPRPLQCVGYARAESGIAIRGDAATWWQQAQGRYARGFEPARGAVLVLARTSRVKRGHLAVVRQIVNNREIIVDHANWLNQGRIHMSTPVRDISPDNDWSVVRVWYTPGNIYGARNYLVQGFIHPDPAVASSAQ